MVNIVLATSLSKCAAQVNRLGQKATHSCSSDELCHDDIETNTVVYDHYHCHCR